MLKGLEYVLCEVQRRSHPCAQVSVVGKLDAARLFAVVFNDRTRGYKLKHKDFYFCILRRSCCILMETSW